MLVVTSPPIFQALSTMGLSSLLNKPWVYDMCDPVVQTAKELGMVSAGWVYRWLRRVEQICYRRCSSVVVATRSFIDLVQADGPPAIR